MRHLAAALLALCLCAAVFAGLERGQPPPPAPDAAPSQAPPPVEPAYQLENTSAESTFTTEDGVEVARYAYQLLTLSAANAQELSGEAAAEAERNTAAFNQKMNGLMEASSQTGRAMGEFALSQYEARGRDELYYYDETAASALRLGQIISVRLDNRCYTGGAHPNRYVSGCLFDLRLGLFIDPLQLSGDPEGFRTGAAALLLEKLEARGDILSDCWPEYPEILSRWNEGAVLFDREGMAVVYSPYELGPYTMGEVELRLSYGELEPLVGEEGLARLGVRDGEPPPSMTASKRQANRKQTAGEGE